MIVLGTRGSQLALRQAHIVQKKLYEHHSDLKIDIHIIKTQGDRDSKTSLVQMGGEGVFVKEIEEALLSGKVDVGVHSMKDVPTVLPEGLEIATVLERTEYRDAFISNAYARLSDMPEGSVVGTSSLRRKLQICRYFPHLMMKDIRGNVDTRLQKLDQGEYDAIIMSAVGLDRLNVSDRIKERLDILPAIGQGALCLEVRREDIKTKEIILPLNDRESFLAVELERIFLNSMGGGCQVPIAAIAKVKKDKFFMKALIGSLDGKKILEHNVEGFLTESKKMVLSLSKKLLETGGKEILENVNHG